MLGRRRVTRFSVADALRGTLRILRNDTPLLADLRTNHDDGRNGFGASPQLAPSPHGDTTEKVIVDGTPHDRLRRETVNDHPFDDAAVVAREVSTQLIELSRDGCLLATSEPIEQGASAELSLHLGDHTCCDEVRIVRCISDEDDCRNFHVAAEFSEHRFHTQSIRRQPGVSHTLATQQPGMKENRS